MPIIDIYHHGKKIETKNFRQGFYILEDLDGRIFWETGEEQAETRRGGTILIWIKCVSHQIAHVSPEWKLTIDGIPLPQEWHMKVEAAGKHISLQYKNYEFVGQFPPLKERDQAA